MHPYTPPYRRAVNPAPPPPRQPNPEPAVVTPPVHVPVTVGQSNGESNSNGNGKTPWKEIMMVAALSGIATMLVSRYGGRILDWIEGKGKRKKNEEEYAVTQLPQQNPQALPATQEERPTITAEVITPEIIERFNDFDRRLHIMEARR